MKKCYFCGAKYPRYKMEVNEDLMEYSPIEVQVCRACKWNLGSDEDCEEMLDEEANDKVDDSIIERRFYGN